MFSTPTEGLLLFHIRGNPLKADLDLRLPPELEYPYSGLNHSVTGPSYNPVFAKPPESALFFLQNCRIVAYKVRYPNLLHAKRDLWMYFFPMRWNEMAAPDRSFPKDPWSKIFAVLWPFEPQKRQFYRNIEPDWDHHFYPDHLVVA